MTGSWELVGGDPAPGSPGVVRGFASTLQQIAQEARSCQHHLDAVRGQWATSDWKGPAAHLFRSRIDTVVPDLAKAADSYGAAAVALEQFATTLDELQTQARAALSRARTARAELTAARDAEASARQRSQEAADEHAGLSDDIDAYVAAITRRTAELRSAAGTDPVIRSWEADLRQVEVLRNGATQRLDQADLDVTTAQRDAQKARGLLTSARGTVEDVRAEFDAAARSARVRLEEAAARGIGNVSFWSTDFRLVTSFVARVSSEALRDAGRFSTDAALIETGHLSGLEDLSAWARDDIVAAAPEIHALTHAWASAANDLAAVVKDCGPYLPIICTVAGAVIGGVVGGVVGLAAGGVGAIPGAIAGASLGAHIGDEGSGDVTAMVDAQATAADAAEVGADDLMRADGKGNTVNAKGDMSALVTHFDATAGEVAGAALPLPGVSTVVTEYLSTGHVNVVTVITTADRQAAGQSVADILADIL